MPEMNPIAPAAAARSIPRAQARGGAPDRNAARVVPFPPLSAPEVEQHLGFARVVEPPA
jgi:hypothetical protein